MKPSHEYDIGNAELMRQLVPLIGGALAWVVILHAVGAAGWLPSARPATDVDSTILVHQADAARTVKDAPIVLLGDSSCLMDVDAAQLGRALQTRCLNLGTLSFLDLESAGRLLELRARADPGTTRWVVLLFHPEALRLAMAEPEAEQFLLDYLMGRHRPSTATLLARLQAYSGLASLKAGVLDRFISAPLSGEFGLRYGFSRQLESHMRAHGGSALDPRSMPFTGNAEYQLAATWEAKCRAFAGRLPAGVRLAVGITPIPASFGPPNHRESRDEMLRTWAMWINADHVLDPLPATLPDDNFASVTHLNETGVRIYTENLTRSLQRWMGQ